VRSTHQLWSERSEEKFVTGISCRPILPISYQSNGRPPDSGESEARGGVRGIGSVPGDLIDDVHVEVGVQGLQPRQVPLGMATVISQACMANL
jgi:hypothetical protein